MAIAFDATSKSGTGTFTTTATWSHTITGTDTYLVVFLDDESGDGAVSVTYNGVAMTQLIKLNLSGTGIYQYMYGLANPATGVNNVVATLTGGHAGFALATSYSGAQQTTPADATVSNTSASTSSPFTTTITTLADNCWTIMGSRSNIGASAGTGSTFRNSRSGADGNDHGIYDSNGAITPAGNYSMGLTFSGTAAPIGTVMVSIAPVAPSGPANMKTYNTNPKANVKSIDTNLIANVKTFDTNA